MPIALKIKTKFYGDWNKVKILNRQLKDRFDALNKYTLIEGANIFKNFIIDRSPSELRKKYMDGAVLYELSSPMVIDKKKTDVIIFAVEPKTHRDILELDPETTLVYIDILENAPFISDIVLFLKNHSPWTLDTIPITPDKKQGAVVKYLSVNPDIVKKVKDEKIKKYNEIKSYFERKGIKIPVKFSKNIEVIDDIGKKALMYEFGYGGVRKKPHLRLSLRDYLTQGLKLLLKHRELYLIMYNVGYSGWRNLPRLPKVGFRMVNLAKAYYHKIKISIPARKVGDEEKDVLKRNKKMSQWVKVLKKWK